MPTDTGYEKGNYLRVCDICGHRFHFRDLKPIGELRFACPDDAPGLTSMQISRFNARARPLVVRPNKWAKDWIETPIYQMAEAELFNFVARAAPADTIGGSSACIPAAWACIYMADIITQNKRPQIWINKATSVLNTCATHLLSRQVGAGLAVGNLLTGQTDARYGGITDDTPNLDQEFSSAVYLTETAIAGGIALVKAYLVTGSTTYLEGAKRCAQFLRHVQCEDLAVGGSEWRVRGFAASVADSTGVVATTFHVYDILGLWLLALLSDIQGSSTEYGDTSSAHFTESTRASLATMMSQARTFAETGVLDVSQGAVVTGLSATAPRSSYSASTREWAGSFIMGAEAMGRGLLGVYRAFGLTDQVTSILAMLSGLHVNPLNETPEDTRPAVLLASNTGTFDPTLCPPIFFTTDLSTSGPFMDVTGSIYDWSACGLLSPAREGALRATKDAFSTARRYDAEKIDLHWLPVYGYSGYSFQTAPFTPTVTRSAKAGIIYRQDPGRYPQLRGN